MHPPRPQPSPAPRLTLVPDAGALRAGARAGRELLAIGTGLVVAVVLMSRLDSWQRQLGTFQALYVLAFGFFALALTRTGTAHVPRAGLLVFGVALACRVALLPVAPTLSDDIYRYIWEGKVAAHGGDPYRHSPADPSLTALRDRHIHPRINHPELATIYPPLAIGEFALVARLSPTVWAMKSWIVLQDLLLVAVLLAGLRARQGSPLLAVAYAWNPLVLTEFAGSGHNDPIAMMPLAAALLWAERRPVLSALALAAGVLTKLAPVLALPFLLRRWPARARITALVATGAGLAWMWAQTRGVDSGLGAYARTWANNEFAFHVLRQWIGDPIPARTVAALLLAAVIAWALWRGWDAARGTRLATRAAFLLTPVAHPWYLGWPLMFEPLAPSAPWLLLSLTAVLSYGIFAPPAEGGGFHLPLAWRGLEYGAPLALAVVLAIVRRGRRSQSKHTLGE